jgi:hypothetical protein
VPSVQQIQVGLDRYRDAALAAFEDNLGRIVEKAQAATLQYVLEDLTIEDGMIARTPGNLRIFRRLSQIFMRELDHSGYTALVNAFVAQFPGHLPTISQMLEVISESSPTPLPKLDFTLSDLNLFKSVAVTSAQNIRTIIAAEASKAVSKVMFNLGGLPFKDMVNVIQNGFGVTLQSATNYADLAQSAFYRVALQTQYDKIQARTKKILRYRYSGPRDERNRPFCAHLMATPKQSYTKEEIDAMDNGTPLPVWTFCGAWSCRHEWLLSFDS